jgi:hypothetical protein
MAVNGMSFGCNLLANCQTFSPLKSENWHGLTPIDGQQKPASSCIITYQTHMEDIHMSEGN